MITRKFDLCCGLLLAAMFTITARCAPLQGPCEEELQRYCSDVKPGQWRMTDCLKRHADSLSTECTDYLKQWGKELNDLQVACAEDIHDYCRDVTTSYRRVIACLKQHVNEVSAGCHTLLAKGASKKQDTARVH